MNESLIEDFLQCAGPRMESVAVYGLAMDVTFAYEPGRPATWDDPAVPEQIELIAVCIGGVDVVEMLEPIQMADIEAAVLRKVQP